MGEHQPEQARAEMQAAHALSNQALSQDKSKLAGLLEDNAPTQPAVVPAGPAARHHVDSGAALDLAAVEKRLTPAIADSYNNLGATAAVRADYLLAMKDFERAAEWDPSLDGLDYNWGRAAFMASRFSDAIPPLSRYVRAHPGESGGHAALAMSQFMTGDYPGCLATLQGVEAATASIPQMQYIYAESLVKTGKVASGTERLEALKLEHPEIAEVHRGLGEVFALQGQQKKALDELHMAIQLNANDPEAHYLLGKVELDGGNAAGAIPEFTSAIGLLSTDPRFHRGLAAAYQSASRTADAEKELRILNTLETSQARPASGPLSSSETPEK